MKKILRKAWKFLWITLVVLLVLVILAFIALKLPVAQRFIADKAEQFVEDKTNTAVNIGKLNINFPKNVSIENLFVEDRNKDTLLYAGKIGVFISLSDLMSQNITLTQIELADIDARVIKKDSTFNFNHFITAFSDTTSQKQAQPDTTSGSTWQFRIQDISLENISARYYDLDSGDSTNAFLGNFETSFNTFDLEKQQFYLDEILLENTRAQVAIHSQPAPEQEDTTSSTLPDVKFESINLKSIVANYRNHPGQQEFSADLSTLSLTPEELDLQNNKIELDEFEMSNSSFSASVFSRRDTTTTQTEESSGQGFPLDIPWEVSLADLDLNEISLEYHNRAFPDTATGFDANHLSVAGFDLGLDNFNLANSELVASLNDVSLKTSDGFKLDELKADLLFNDQKMSATNLTLATSKSQMGGNARLDYTSFSAFLADINNASFNLDLDSKKMSTADLAYWVPQLADSIFNPEKPSFNFSIIASGSTADAALIKLTLGFGKETQFSAEGNAQNVLDPELLSFDLGLEHEIFASDVKAFLHPALLPEGLGLPSRTSGTYDVSGKINDLYTEIDISSELGEIFGNVHLTDFTKETAPSYDVDISAESLDLQTITKGDSTGVGLCSFELKAKGSGFEPAKMNNEFALKLHQIQFNRYDYREFDLSGEIENGMLTSAGGIRDSNIIISLENTINLQNIFDSEVLINVEAADLQNLNFAQEDIRLKGKLKAKSSGTGLTDLKANVDLRNALVIKENDRYYLDSLLVNAELGESKTDFQINSDMLNGWLKGNLPPDEIVLSLQQQVNNYIDIFEISSDTLAQNPHFAFSFSINQTDLISEVILPELKSFEVGRIEGQFNEPDVGSVNMSINVPNLKYADFQIDSLSFSMTGDRDSLKSTLGFDKLDFDTLSIHRTTLNAKIGKGNIYLDLGILDTAQTQEYALGASIRRLDDTVSISLDEELLLHYNVWNANPQNALLISDRLNFRNFEISHEQMKLAARDIEGGYEINAQDFSLAAISGMLSGEIVPLAGMLNGKVTMKEDENLSADLQINDIRVFEKPLGNIDLAVKNPDGSTYDLNLSLTGNGNDLQSSGSLVFADSTSSIDISTSINKISLESFTPFTIGYLSDMSGNLRGKVNVNGSLSSPEISGNLRFDQAWMKVDYLNAYFNLRDERIDIQTDGFRFPNFTVRDSTGNKAQIDGNVLTENYTDYDFDLSIKTNDYKVMSTTKESSEFYYGTIILDSDIQVKGPMTSLDVTANINLEKGTEFNMLIPQSDVAARDRAGIVEFIDPDASIEESILTRSKVSSASQADFTNLNFNSTVTVDKETRVNIIIDPVTGDKLSVQGGATLSVGINPGGDINMVGNYVIQEGKYEMKAFGVMRREFSIKEGSSLEWSGDPLEAQMDITAIYETRTSPYNLVAPYISSTGSNAELQQLKGQLPFKVYLMMKGELMSPAISFDIELPQNQRNAMGGRVYARLNQLRENESALNKQVFALLVLNSFIAEDPTAGSNDGSSPASSAARKSVSRFLSDQLNRLSDKYIQGVDVQVDVESYEDFSSGGASGQTDVNLNVSKSLMNDRLILRVGSSIAVEGEAAQQQNASDITGDLVLEYKITEDGRYRFKAFRVNSYENLAVGQVTETGGGIIFTRDYNEFKELFRKPEEDQNKVKEKE